MRVCGVCVSVLEGDTDAETPKRRALSVCVDVCVSSERVCVVETKLSEKCMWRVGVRFVRVQCVCERRVSGKCMENYLVCVMCVWRVYSVVYVSYSTVL